MALYMMALGAFPESSVLPSSYFGAAIPLGEQAEYVLVYGYEKSAHPSGLELAPVFEWKDGAVYRRPR